MSAGVGRALVEANPSDGAADVRLDETPSSSGPLTPLSIAAGTVVLGQIVCCAAALPEHVRASNRPNSAGPACFNNLKNECIKRLCILVFKRIPPK